MQENLRISISKATLIVFGLTFLGQAIGFFSQMILANFFGVGSEIDSYVVSSIFPEFIFGITNAVFVVALVALLPDYIKKKGVDAGKRFYSSLFGFTLIALAAITLILLIFAPFMIKLLAPGFSSEQHLSAVIMFRIATFSVVFLGLSSVTSALLYSQFKFFAPKSLRIFLGVGVITAVILLQELLGQFSAAFGLVFGAFAGFLFQFIAVQHTQFKISHFELPSVQEKYFKRLFALSLPVVFTSIFYYINKSVTTIIASTLEAGSISILAFAFIIANVPLTFFSESISASTFPYLVSNSARKGVVNKIFTRTVQLVLFAIVPFSVFFLIFSNEIIMLVFQRGAFTISSANAVAGVFFIFALGLIPMSVFNLVTPFLHAKKLMKQRMLFYLLFLILNAFAMLILSKKFSYFGMAGGTAASYWATAFFALWYVKKRLSVNLLPITKSFLKLIFAGIVFGFLTYLLRYIFNSANLFGLVIIFLVGACFYALILKVLRAEELTLVWNLIKTQLPTNEKQ